MLWRVQNFGGKPSAALAGDLGTLRHNTMLSQNRREQRPVYSFPELRNAEILQCLEDLRIPVVDTDLAKPNSSTILRVYEAFVDIFMGASAREPFQQPGLAFTEILEYPELHTDSIALITFYRTISKLMAEVGIEDFSLKDLIRPEAPRLKLILSAIINFAKFREEQLGVFEDFSRKSEELIEQRSKLASRDAELTAKISYFKQRRLEEEPALVKAREQISAMINELREFKKEQAAMTNELEQLKATKTELTDKMNQNNFLSSNIKQECNKLKSRIVHSPDKLMQIIAEMNASINSEKANLAQLEKKSRELQMKLDALTQVEQDITRALNLLEQNDEIVRKRDSLVIQLQDDRETINKKNVYIKDLELKEQQCRRQLTVSQEKHAKLLQQQDHRREQIQAQLTTLRQDYTTLSEERARLINKMDQTEKTIKEMESKLFDLRRSHDNEMFNLRADCLNLKTQASHYLNEVKKSL